MTITLYELAAADASLRFSPHCWKTRLALVHKQLPYESVPVRFGEKHKIEFSGQPLVPVLQDSDNSIHDSWEIALYLDKHYSDKPLFANDHVREAAREFNEWVTTQVMSCILPSVLLSVYGLLTEEDKVYFRENRQQRFGATLEEVAATAPAKLAELESALASLNEPLAEHTFLGGESPDYRDICLFATFMWPATTSNANFLGNNQRLRQWYQDMSAYYRDTLPDTVLLAA